MANFRNNILVIFLFFSTNCMAARDNETCNITLGVPFSSAGYGPWDYTNPAHKSKLGTVLSAHFTEDVAKLRRGSSNQDPAGDIGYTLQKIPNYHPALIAASNLELIKKSRLKNGQIYKPVGYTVECFFKRAIHFQPKDYVVYYLFGIYYHKGGQYKKSEAQYKKALSFIPNHPEINYNLGLLYLKLKNIEQAKHHADIAYKGGYQLKGLKNKIARFNQ